jgi:hypothetical protein
MVPTPGETRIEYSLTLFRRRWGPSALVSDVWNLAHVINLVASDLKSRDIDALMRVYDAAFIELEIRAYLTGENLLFHPIFSQTRENMVGSDPKQCLSSIQKET